MQTKIQLRAYLIQVERFGEISASTGAHGLNNSTCSSNAVMAMMGIFAWRGSALTIFRNGVAIHDRHIDVQENQIDFFQFLSWFAGKMILISPASY